MTEQDKRKVDIYSLYKKEKTVHIEDDEGNYIDILLTKMTQGDRMNVLNTYNEYLETQRIKLREKEDKFHTLSLAIERYRTEDLIEALVIYETTQRSDVVDLYPSLDGKSEEERAKIIAEEIDKFKKMRREELKKETHESLQKKFIDMTLEYQALVDAVRILNYTSLVKMCINPETKEKMFNSIDDIEKITDRRVIDKLIDAITEFRALETQKEVRKVAANDSSFLPAGESQKS